MVTILYAGLRISLTKMPRRRMRKKGRGAGEEEEDRSLI